MRWARMDDEKVWAMEESLWTGDAGHMGAIVDPACLMVFPDPAGIMAAEAALEGLKSAPRWDKVMMTGRQIARPGDGLLILAYKAVGTRSAAADYTALCSSTYRRDGERWRLVQHQQTPFMS